MKRSGKTVMIILSATALAWSQGWAGDVERLKAGEESVLAVPRLSAPPVVDGVIGAEEWRGAMAVSGAVDQGNDVLDPRPLTFFLGWDPGHLHFACRAYLPKDYKLAIPSGRSPDGASCFDDGLEMLFKPLGGNVDAERHATEYKLNINALGNCGDYTRLVVGQILKNWDPQPKAAARVTAPGTAPGGGSWWELEFTFSTKDFELVGPNRAGDKWLMMLGVNHLPNNMWMQERIPCVGGYFTPQGKTAVTLVEGAPAVQMTMDSLSNLSADGTAKLKVVAFNPADLAKQVKVEVEVAGKIAKAATLDLPPGGEKAFVLDERLPAGVKDGRFSLRVSEGALTLLSYTAGFVVGANPGRLQPAKAIDPNDFIFAAKFNPVRRLLWLRADTYCLPKPEDAKALAYRVVRKGDGAAVAEGEVTKVAEWYFDQVLELKDLQPGDYEVTASIHLKDGKVFGPRKAAFAKLDEAKAYPDWWGNQFGEPERVVPPFEEIKMSQTSPTGQTGQTFSCWGREYELGALGLPQAVSSQGAAVLAAPARVVVTVDGKETVVSLGAAEIVDAKDWRARFAGKAEGAGLEFAADGTLEQDGLVTVNLTYQPKGGGKARIDALRLEFPVADAVAECLVCLGPGGNFAAKTATVLPEGKQGRLWSVLDIGRKGSGMKVGSFYPGVWLGGDRRGLLWWADNDRGWLPDNETPAHEVFRDGAAVVLRNNLVGKPAELDGPRQVSFTWMASPFKPLPKGWRMYAATDDGTFAVPFRGLRINPKTGKKYLESGIASWINPESEDPAEWSKLWAEQKVAADAHVKRTLPFDLYAARTGVDFHHMSFQLIGYGHKSMEDAVFDYFGDEWYVASGHGDTWNPSYVDYAMWLFDRAFREGGVVSTYWDLSFPIFFDSPLCGLAHELPDGRWQPGYNSLNCRNFFKRLWAVQDKNHLTPGCTGSHSTNAYLLPSLPWIDTLVDGERDWNLDASDMDWVDYYPVERMRSLSSPHNWGIGICWMGNFTAVDKRKVQLERAKQAEYVWMYDSWINPWLTPNFGITRMPRNILDWGLNGEGVEYHPFWRNPYAQAGKDMLVSLWRIPGEAGGRVLVGAFNYDGKATRDIEVKLDLAKLGLGGKAVVEARDLSKNFLDSPLAKGGDPIGCEFWGGVVPDDALALIRGGQGAAAEFDPATGVLRLKGVGPHRGRYVGLGATDPDALAAAREAMPANLGGMLATVGDQGFIRKDTQRQAPGSDPRISCADPGVEVASWVLPDRVLLLVGNPRGGQARDVAVKLDLAKLGIAPTLRWQEFIAVRDLSGGLWDVRPPKLDAQSGVLTLKALEPNTTRLLSVRKM